MNRTKLLLPCLFASLFLLPLTSRADNHAPRHVGITVGSLSNPFYQELVRGAIQKARSLNPDVRITSLSANFNLSTQQEQMQQLIHDKVDQILLAAVDSQGIGPMVRRARQAGIMVIAVDVASPDVNGTVMSDNLQAGELACRYLAQRMHGKGNFIIQNGPPVSSVRNRVSGCHKALSAYPQIRILSDNENGFASNRGGYKLMKQHLAHFPVINAVFAINERQALGAEQAIHAARRDDIQIAGVDGSPELERALAEKNAIVAFVSQQPQTIGAEAIALGQQLRSHKLHDTPTVTVPVRLITRENLSSYKGWMNSHPHSTHRQTSPEMPPLPKQVFDH